MLNEKYSNPTIYFFGKDQEKNLDYIKQKNYLKVLIHYGQGSIKSNGIYNKITAILQEFKIDYLELGGVEENPKSDLVNEGIELCKKYNVDFILAIGGGSVIDSTKAISIGSKTKSNFFDFFEGKQEPQNATDFGIIVTNSGAGSETSATSVITCSQTKIKKAYVHPLMRARFAVLNPDFTITVPLYTTTCGIVDSISHVFERYFSNTEYVDCSDRLSEALIQTLMKYALLIQKEPNNYDYRSEIMWASKMASDQIMYLGRKQEWTCHYIAHLIGSITDKKHGEILAIIFPSWMKYVYRSNEKLFLQFSKRIFKSSNIEEAIQKYILFLKKVKMPTTLREIGFTNQDDFKYIASELAKINPSATLGNFQRLSKNDILHILNAAV